LKASEPIPEFKRAVLCTNATKGFYHWYAERLPSLAWAVNTGQLDAPILFGSHAARFQDDTMALLNVGPGGFARVGDAAYCKSVYVAHMSLACLADWQRYSDIFDTLAENAKLKSGKVTASRMIYISRRDTDRRVMRNESELEARLAKLGVESIVFSKIPLAEQINLIRRATVVIGAHGAGMTHILNARSGLRVLELMPAQSGYHALRFNYARISRLRGHWHTLWLEPINPATRGWAVDIDKVCALAGSIIEGK
jgi:capsular polysaccharide biosynthesis protein